MQLLLLSNSTGERGFLADWLDLLHAFVGDVSEALFVPYASVVHSWESYESRVREALAPAGIAVRSIHRETDAIAAVQAAQCVIVGGGNTFHLLHHCRRAGILRPLERRVRDGMRYVGWSAGANLACPTIRTTNDMPVVDPGGLDALGLVDFQINPHFSDALPPGHHGETRTQRLAEFTALNPGVPVLALPEGCHLRVDGDALRYGGSRAGLWLVHGQAPAEVTEGALIRPRPVLGR
jgi:dipeptidase E